MKNSTRIVILLDRSGSMEVCRESTLSGLNSFIKGQKELPGDATLKLVVFDSTGLSQKGMDYKTVFDLPIGKAPKLTEEDFIPRGNTPLLDAQGKTINDLGNELKNLPESERPEKVIVVTITDGLENDSREYTAFQIKEKIKHQTEKYSWDFVYLGANQDAVQVGSGLGWSSGKAMTYDAQNATNVGATYQNLNRYVGATRSASSASAAASNVFTEEERGSSIGEHGHKK